MKIQLIAEVDPDEVLALVDIPEKTKTECIAFIRRVAKFQFQMLLHESDGGWVYPTADWLATQLVYEGLATAKI